LMSRVMRRMHNRSLWHAWRLWLEFVESDKIADFKRAVASMADKQQSVAVSNLVRRWRHRTVVSAFE
jgi:hypothetical protein